MNWKPLHQQSDKELEEHLKTLEARVTMYEREGPLVTSISHAANMQRSYNNTLTIVALYKKEIERRKNKSE